MKTPVVSFRQAVNMAKKEKQEKLMRLAGIITLAFILAYGYIHTLQAIAYAFYN